MVFPRFGGWMAKGIQKRQPEQQRALIVRILDGRHATDVVQRALDELGGRALTIGPIDLTRNVLANAVDRLGRAYLTPPLVSGISEDLARWMGDQSASTTIAKYAKAGGRPMPTEQSRSSVEVLRYRLGAGYSGTLIGYSERTKRPFFRCISPDDLELVYGGDDPSEPTVIRHRCIREMGGNSVVVIEEYDLTDAENPHYRILHDGSDVTADTLDGATYEGGDYPWRWEDGTPYHRIVIEGDDRHPYRTNTQVEATLRVCVLWTHWAAGVRDAGHPSRHGIGIEVDGSDSDSATGQTGQSSGPEVVHIWRHIDPERPGSLQQLGPGFDPEVIGRAVREYELAAISALGLPVSFERTGGEPTETERLALDEAIAATFPDCRRFDGQIIARTAALANRLGALPAQSETPPAILYRGEVLEALADANTTENGTNG